MESAGHQKLRSAARKRRRTGTEGGPPTLEFLTAISNQQASEKRDVEMKEVDLEADEKSVCRARTDGQEDNEKNDEGKKLSNRRKGRISLRWL